jgi:protein tyrosine phosphatase (PTP) superfamily phosphohydrolase (DUF442 family)
LVPAFCWCQPSWRSFSPRLTPCSTPPACAAALHSLPPPTLSVLSPRATRRSQSKLLSALASTVSLPFPPAPDALLTKVTDDSAFSSQPTLKQILGLRPFGFLSVISLRLPHEKGVQAEEEEECKRNSVRFFSCPVPQPCCSNEDATGSMEALVAAVDAALCAHRIAPKPVLVHCDTGKRSCAVVLVHAARALRADFKQVLRWGLDLGHDLTDMPWLQYLLPDQAVSDSLAAAAAGVAAPAPR